METSMISVFFVSLFMTFFIVRFFAHKLDGPYEMRARTPTKKLRHKTGYDIHHIHIGIAILIVIFVGILFDEISKIDVMFLGIGSSLVLDQLAPWFNQDIGYFNKKSILYAFALHLFVFMIYFIGKRIL